MENKTPSELNVKWKQLLVSLEAQFGEEPDLQTILFLIGVNELGKGAMEFTKGQKMDLMHIATCSLLSQYGYYLYEGLDTDGWPHYTLVEKLPPLKIGQQEDLLREAILSYFDVSDIKE
jgi:hypothetical protein